MQFNTYPSIAYNHISTIVCFTFLSLFSFQGTPAVGTSRSLAIFLPPNLSRSYRPHVFGCLSRRSAGHHCSQSFPLVRVVPRRQPLVGSSGLEPPTSRLSGVRSNHLSYEPIFRGRLWFAFPAYLFPRCSLPAFLRPRATTVPSRFPSFASCLQRSWWWR